MRGGGRGRGGDNGTWVLLFLNCVVQEKKENGRMGKRTRKRGRIQERENENKEHVQRFHHRHPYLLCHIMHTSILCPYASPSRVEQKLCIRRLCRQFLATNQQEQEQEFLEVVVCDSCTFFYSFSGKERVLGLLLSSVTVWRYCG